MNFGVPNQRKTKQPEKYPNTPVLIMGVAGEKGTARTMSLNKEAVKILGLSEEDASVAFSFDKNGVHITNGNHEVIPTKFKIRVTNGDPRRFSEKKTYEYMSSKAFENELDNSIENEFVLESSPVISEEGAPVLFNLKEIISSESVNEGLKNDDILDTAEFKGFESRIDENEHKSDNSIDNSFDNVLENTEEEKRQEQY